MPAESYSLSERQEEEPATCAENTNVPLRFKSTEYQDPSPFPQRPDRWYNGSLMGSGGKDSTLFGPKGRLRSLQSKITSQETPGYQPRSQHYRLIGDLLSRFFSFGILDPLIEELTTYENIRLPRETDEAVSIVLAAVEMYLRKNNRMILKEGIIAEIAAEFGLDITRKKISAARWFLAKGGFWQEHLHEINTTTYEILRTLVLEVITNNQFPIQDDLFSFRRQLYQRCNALIDLIEKNSRRPQFLEIYAHAVVNIAAEEVLGNRVRISNGLDKPNFGARVYRVKKLILDMIKKSSKKSSPKKESRSLPKLFPSRFSELVRRVFPDELPPEGIQIVRGELLRFKMLQDVEVECSTKSPILSELMNQTKETSLEPGNYFDPANFRTRFFDSPAASKETEIGPPNSELI
ncbi:MAG: hypothetical protein ACXAEI_07310 [Candidatus Hodarchaeales archaeon]|jgi:hypothetical protein